MSSNEVVMIENGSSEEWRENGYIILYENGILAGNEKDKCMSVKEG